MHQRIDQIACWSSKMFCGQKPGHPFIRRRTIVHQFNQLELKWRPKVSYGCGTSWLTVCCSVKSVWWRCSRAPRSRNCSSSPRLLSRQSSSVWSAILWPAAVATWRSARASKLISFCRMNRRLTLSSVSVLSLFMSAPHIQFYSSSAGNAIARSVFCTFVKSDASPVQVQGVCNGMLVLACAILVIAGQARWEGGGEKFYLASRRSVGGPGPSSSKNIFAMCPTAKLIMAYVSRQLLCATFSQQSWLFLGWIEWCVNGFGSKFLQLNFSYNWRTGEQLTEDGWNRWMFQSETRSKIVI